MKPVSKTPILTTVRAPTPSTGGCWRLLLLFIFKLLMTTHGIFWGGGVGGGGVKQFCEETQPNTTENMTLVM